MRDIAADERELHATFEGWWALIQECHEKLLALDPDYMIHQIKEKFGTLRYYYGTMLDDHDEMDKIIQAAENRSAVTCEICGQPGKYCSLGYWSMTRCDTCFRVAQLRRQGGKSPV